MFYNEILTDAHDAVGEDVHEVPVVEHLELHQLTNQR